MHFFFVAINGKESNYLPIGTTEEQGGIFARHVPLCLLVVLVNNK